MEEKVLSVLVRQGMRKNCTKAQKEAINLLEKKEQAFNQTELELKEAKTQLEEKVKQLAQLNCILDNTRAEAQMQKDILTGEIARLGDLDNKYADLDKKMNTAYTAKDLSNYLNQVIKEFNDSKASDSQMATYVINNMDVDLKTRIYAEDGSNLKFCAPDITEKSEDSLSSIKISIQAIPK